MDKLIINLLGIIVVALIIWWFWLSKPKAKMIKDSAINILVDNGTYEPSRIEVEVGKKIVLRFLRKDASPCSEKVVFDDFDISTDLPLNKIKKIEITPDKPGEYRFTCQMQMYQGSLVVK